MKNLVKNLRKEREEIQKDFREKHNKQINYLKKKYKKEEELKVPEELSEYDDIDAFKSVDEVDNVIDPQENSEDIMTMHLPG